MEKNELVQKFQRFVINNGLPKTDMSFFGITCPYCGKSDRIRQLEEPDELEGDLSTDEIEKYTGYWKLLKHPDGSLGVCKFCQNPLNIFLQEGRAEALLV